MGYTLERHRLRGTLELVAVPRVHLVRDRVRDRVRVRVRARARVRARVRIRVSLAPHGAPSSPAASC